MSRNERWNAETIYQRGIALLKFMEKRWELKFENEEAMAELLFLGFMQEQLTEEV